jgi:hypothetical protein
MDRFVEFVGLRLRCAEGLIKDEWFVFFSDLEGRYAQAAKFFYKNSSHCF